MTATRHRHNWKSQRPVFMQNGLGCWLAIMANCKCGAARGYTPGSTHKDAAELAYELEALGDGFLSFGQRRWIYSRRKLCPV